MKGSFIRCGDADEPMTEREIYSCQAYRQHIHDDEQVCDGGLKFINQLLLHAFIEKCRENRPNFSKNFSDDELLESAGVLREGKPTLAALLVFSEVPQLYYPELSVIAYVVPGVELGQMGSNQERFTDNKRIEGSVQTMLDDTLAFIRRNTRNQIRIDASGKRTDCCEYPPIAVREAVLNALMHRDYSRFSIGLPVQVAIFHDRLEITSPGSLFGTSSVARLGLQRMEIRNSRLSILLETAGIAEHRYSGIQTIRKECTQAGLPQPEFISRNGEFKVILRNDFHSGHEQMPAKDANLTDGRLEDSLSRMQQNVLRFCHIPRSRKEIMEQTGRSAVFVREEILAPMLEKGWLEMTMPNKPKSKNQMFVARIARRD